MVASGTVKVILEKGILELEVIEEPEVEISLLVTVWFRLLFTYKLPVVLPLVVYPELVLKNCIEISDMVIVVPSTA